jgi:hypothetical protein
MQSLIEIRLLVLGMRRAEVKLRVAGPDEHVLGESLSAWQCPALWLIPAISAHVTQLQPPAATSVRLPNESPPWSQPLT